MPVNIIPTDITTSTEIFSNDMWILNAGVNIALDDTPVDGAMFGTGIENSFIQLYGHVFSYYSAIVLFDASNNNSIYLGTTGSIFSALSAIAMVGDSNNVVNDGSIDSWGAAGVYFEGNSNVLTNRGGITGCTSGVGVSGDGNTIVNYGTIGISTFTPSFFDDPVAIRISSDTDMHNLVRNYGTITSIVTAIVGGEGDDYIENSGRISGNITLGAGNDQLDNSDGIIHGEIDLGEGNDTYIGGTDEYVNQVVGGAGNDIYILQGGLRLILEDVGGGDADALAIDVTATLIQNIEILFLYGSADINGAGNALDNTITGNHGDNRLRGRGGSDTLLGGGGEDVLNGGAGIDTASYDFSDEGVSINLGKNTVSGGHAEGDTFISIENLLGSEFADTLIGDTGANRIEGGLGSDTIDGGKGNDTLVGGAGIDKFIFAKKTGHDTIEGFTTTGIEADRIDVHAFRPKSFADLQSHMADDGANVEITYGHDVLTLVGIHKVDLGTDHFIL